LALMTGLMAGAGAQYPGRGPGMRPPSMPGTFKPVVGAGGQYQMQVKDRTMKVAYAVVGTEDVEGTPGYWMEIRTEGAGMPGEMVMKQLMVVQAGKGEVKRMIMQAPGQPPMEMPVGFMPGMGPRGQSTQPRAETSPPEKVGTESVTVPAGTFVCDHYRQQMRNGAVDYWVSEQVSPYGVIKLTGLDMTMELEKVLSNETSHIKGEPQKFQMPQMPQS
jgi:hypothetical protein